MNRATQNKGKTTRLNLSGTLPELMLPLLDPISASISSINYCKSDESTDLTPLFNFLPTTLSTLKTISVNRSDIVQVLREVPSELQSFGVQLIHTEPLSIKILKVIEEVIGERRLKKLGDLVLPQYYRGGI